MRKLYLLLLTLTSLFPWEGNTSLRGQVLADLVDDAGKSIVLILVYDEWGILSGQGSGLFIDYEGRIITNAHVVRQAHSVCITSLAGESKVVQVLHKDERRDLALLRVPFTHTTPIRIAQQRHFRAGQRVIAIGNPLGLERTVSDGIISGIRRTESGVEVLQTTAAIAPGSSGGALLDENGGLIGITSATYRMGQNINFAVSLNEIVGFLEEYERIGPQGRNSQQLPTDGAPDSEREGGVLAKIWTFIVVVVLGGALHFILWILSLLGL